MNLSKTLIVAGTCLIALNAHSAVSYGSSSAGQPYVGIKAGQIDLDGMSGKATSYGIYGGYNFDQSLGIEAEYQGSEDKKIANNTEYNVKTYGVYGTYRYHFAKTPVYGKAKLGLAKSQSEIQYASHTSKSDTTGVTGGLAVGFKANPNFGIEAGFNRLASDANQWTIGAHFAF